MDTKSSKDRLGRGGQSKRPFSQMAFLVTVNSIWLFVLLLFSNPTAGNATDVGHRRAGAGSLPQQHGPTQSLGRLAMGQRLLLVLTLDGTLAAYDRYSGALYWRTTELQGGRPIIHGSSASNVNEGGPLYIFEPVGPASAFVYLPGGGIQVSEHHKSSSTHCFP